MLVAVVVVAAGCVSLQVLAPWHVPSVLAPWHVPSADAWGKG